LEAGDGNLDHAIDAYARGALLKRHCENKLMDAKTRIDKVVLDAEGDPYAEPLDTE
jgi:exodeoxyribonuclease VII small subunit